MKKNNVQMVDLMGQYSKIKSEIDRNIISSIESGRFVNGPIVKDFSDNLSSYLNVQNVIIVINVKDVNPVKIVMTVRDVRAAKIVMTVSIVLIVRIARIV